MLKKAAERPLAGGKYADEDGGARSNRKA